MTCGSEALPLVAIEGGFNPVGHAGSDWAQLIFVALAFTLAFGKVVLLVTLVLWLRRHTHREHARQAE